MSELVFPGAGDAVIQSPAGLAEAFAAAAKRPEAFRVGFEVECFGVDRHTGDAIPYGGSSGVEAILRGMSQEFGWETILEDDRPVALARGESRVTLEPGGQIELSSRPERDLFALAEEFARYRSELAAAGRALGVVFLGTGTHPFTPVDRIGWVPKARYDRMKVYLPSRGHLAHHMMKSTASIQASFDFSGEEDMRSKFRVGLALAPVALALFANSPLSDSHPNGFLSLRGHIWRYTDPSRSGLVRAALEDDRFGYEDYVQFALDVPLMLLYRNGRYLPVEDISFRRFIEKGYQGYPARHRDWSLHLSTLFTEVRLKTVLEFRSADAQRPDHSLAVPAFWKGLFYDPGVLAQARAMVEGWTYPEVLSLMEVAARRGLEAEFRGRRLAEWGRDVVDLAERGLDAQGATGPDGEPERVFLEPVRRSSESGRPPAAALLEAWNTDPRNVGEWVLGANRY